jgi:hypothetical protein
MLAVDLAFELKFRTDEYSEPQNYGVETEWIANTKVSYPPRPLTTEGEAEQNILTNLWVHQDPNQRPKRET